MSNLTIYHISKRPQGHGHWQITLDIQVPVEQLVTGKETINSADRVTITCVTTNSRAIDGLDDADQSLASECLRVNDYDSDDYNIGSLNGGSED
jgi:hypothetical protein